MTAPKSVGNAEVAGIRYSEHLTGDGRAIFEHACKLGLEGIVSKRINAPYRSGKVKLGSRRKIRRPRPGCACKRAADTPKRETTTSR